MTPQQMQQTVDRVLTLESRKKNTREVIQWFESLDEQGRWADIDYKHNQRAQWDPMNHASRLAHMALMWHDLNPDDAQRDTLGQAVIRGLDRWLEMKLESPNWWHNQIGVPKLLAIAALSMGDSLPQKTRDGLVALSNKHVKIRMTGANKVWLSENVFLRGLLSGNTQDVLAGIQSIEEEIFISTKEGIQPDMSFHQHGPILMSNSYGLAFLITNLKFMFVVQGTDAAFSPQSKAILTDMLMDGTGLMTYKGQSIPQSMGRSSSRKRGLRRNLSGYYQRLLACDPPGGDAVKEALAVSQGKKPYPARNSMFWSSNLMIHQRPDWHLSIKMFSDRTLSTDGPVNTEGLKNAYMSHGSVFLMRGYDEYIDLPGAWDWQYLPGTTVAISPTYQGKLKQHNGSAFAGGVSDGKVGAAGFELDSNGLHARLAWFCFDDRYFALGTDIHDDNNLPTVTTYDQCYRKTPVWVGDRKGTPRELDDQVSGQLNDALWLWHDDVLYHNLGTSQTCLGPKQQTGNWGDINISCRGTPDVNADVFRAWLKHTDGTFAYAVYPNMPVENVKGKIAATDVKIVSHTSQAIAVYHTQEQLGMAIFFEKGQVQLTDMIRLAVDQPIAVIVRTMPDGKLNMSVASPQQSDSPVNVTVNDQTRRIQLPSNGKAGSTVTTNW
ncbi:MAG TPA: hypothetical protein DER01_03655 [Phycisphaerales bacterium]|nr:hypothetical protein [Phycisphaerales bacterium]